MTAIYDDCEGNSRLWTGESVFCVCVEPRTRRSVYLTKKIYRDSSFIMNSEAISYVL